MSQTGCSLIGSRAGAGNPGLIRSPVRDRQIESLDPGRNIKTTLRNGRIVEGQFDHYDTEAPAIVLQGVDAQETIPTDDVDSVERDNLLWSVLGGAIVGSLLDVLVITWAIGPGIFD